MEIYHDSMKLDSFFYFVQQLVHLYNFFGTSVTDAFVGFTLSLLTLDWNHKVVSTYCGLHKI